MRPTNPVYLSSHELLRRGASRHLIGVLVGGIVWLALHSGASGAAGTFIHHQAESSGIDFVNPFEIEHPMGHLYDSPYGCGGVAAGDVNGDGRADLLFTNGLAANALFLNQGDWKFEKAPFPDGGNPWSAGATMVDIDGDGDLDVFVCNYGSPHQLWLNDGSGQFGGDVASEWGLALEDPGLMASFCDYDRDGDLDVFLQNHREYYPHQFYEGLHLTFEDGKEHVAPGFEKWFAEQDLGGDHQMVGPYGHENRLLRQDLNENGQPHFVDVSEEAGISGYGHSLSVVWWDYDDDGWLDLYESNDYADPDRLYHNNGDGTFSLTTEECLPSVPWFSMGAAVGDINNDGRMDLFASDMAATTHVKAKVAMGSMASRRWLLDNGRPRQAMRNHLFVNSGGERFMESAYWSGVAATDWTWSPCLSDLDQDGRLDLFIGNGMARFFTDADGPKVRHSYAHHGWEAMRYEPPLKERNLVFANQGGLEFSDVSEVWGLDHLGMTYAAVAVDLDGDGDQDLVTTNLGEQVALFENQVASGHWLKVRLQGEGRNSAGLGARVRVVDSEGGIQLREMTPVTGFLSCSEGIVHFGLKTGGKLRSLEVRWPTGEVSLLENVSCDQVLVVDQESAEAPPEIQKSGAALKRVSKPLGLDYKHREREFDDFALQPLLPARLSRDGPALAVGDADDRDLVYLGGAAGQTGALYQWTGDRFVRQDGPWKDEAEGEDVDAVFFDAEGDGDLDLVVARGSTEHAEGSGELADVFYRNDGSGVFMKDPDALPDRREYSSVVTVNDWDGDERPDLFIGSRVVVGSYPTAHSPRLLRNCSTTKQIRFEDVTDSLAPDLKDVGMVRGAVWTSLDEDPEDELVICLEWGGLLVFDRKDGRMVRRETDMEKKTGWWSGLVAADVDGDGDQDLLALNTGWNSKYGRPSGDKPAVLYYGPMEREGAPRLVEATIKGKTMLPVRGRSCSAGAEKWIKQAFPTYLDFAQASLDEIYDEERLDGARRYEAVTLQSGVFLNEGDFRFRFEAFPVEAQLAPINDAAVRDWTGDGKPDILLVQGFSGREPETGLWRGAPGILLAGQGEGRFRAMNAAESGFLVPGDGRKLEVLRSGKNRRVLVVRNDDEALLFASEPESK